MDLGEVDAWSTSWNLEADVRTRSLEGPGLSQRDGGCELPVALVAGDGAGAPEAEVFRWRLSNQPKQCFHGSCEQTMALSFR